MANKTLIGIDIGTQGAKAVIFSEDGECLASAFEASELNQPSPGVVEEDPDRQFGSVCRTVRECMKKSGTEPGSVGGIAIDGQMAGVIGVDDRGKAVTPYDSWLDTRCAPYIEEMERAAGDEIVAKAGCPASYNHGPKIVWWMRERPETYARIKSFVQPGGYAAMRLCGLGAKDAFIDTSYLHFCGFSDNANSRWNQAICDEFGVDVAKLPEIVEPSKVVGEVTVEAAGECGIRPGVPVVAGCGDTAASFLSCGAAEVGICVDVAGTASVFATTTDGFKPDVVNKVLACGRSATPGLWHPYAYVMGGGMNLEWFKREIAGRGNSDTISFDELNRLAQSMEPSSDLPFFVPHFAGRTCPSQPNLRGAWANLTWSHEMGDLYRAILESVALEYGLYKRVLLSLYLGFDMKQVRITGGGEKSAVWNSMKADVLGTDVVAVSRTQGAPMGSAMLAGFGVGLINDLPAAAKQWIGIGKVTKPNAEMADYYQSRLGRYSRLMDRLNGF